MARCIEIIGEPGLAMFSYLCQNCCEYGVLGFIPQPDEVWD